MCPRLNWNLEVLVFELNWFYSTEGVCVLYRFNFFFFAWAGVLGRKGFGGGNQGLFPQFVRCLVSVFRRRSLNSFDSRGH